MQLFQYVSVGDDRLLCPPLGVLCGEYLLLTQSWVIHHLPNNAEQETKTVIDQDSIQPNCVAFCWTVNLLARYKSAQNLWLSFISRS